MLTWMCIDLFWLQDLKCFMICSSKQKEIHFKLLIFHFMPTNAWSLTFTLMTLKSLRIRKMPLFWLKFSNYVRSTSLQTLWIIVRFNSRRLSRNKLMFHNLTSKRESSKKQKKDLNNRLVKDPQINKIWKDSFSFQMEEYLFSTMTCLRKLWIKELSLILKRTTQRKIKKKKMKKLRRISVSNTNRNLKEELYLSPNDRRNNERSLILDLKKKKQHFLILKSKKFLPSQTIF